MLIAKVIQAEGINKEVNKETIKKEVDRKTGNKKKSSFLKQQMAAEEWVVQVSRVLAETNVDPEMAWNANEGRFGDWNSLLMVHFSSVGKAVLKLKRREDELTQPIQGKDSGVNVRLIKEMVNSSKSLAEFHVTLWCSQPEKWKVRIPRSCVINMIGAWLERTE